MRLISYDFHYVHMVLNPMDSIHYLFSEDCMDVWLDQPYSRGMMPWEAEQRYQTYDRVTEVW